MPVHSIASQRPRASPRAQASRLLMRCGVRRCPAGSCDHGEQIARQRRNDSLVGPTLVDDVLQSPGRPLDTTVRTNMEARFHHDFSNVRVHADGQAGASANALNADAYTVGQQLVFAPGRFAPATASGRRLLAHELAHAVQQSTSDHRSGPIQVMADDHPGELEAQRAAMSIEAGASIAPTLPTARFQRAAPPPATPPRPADAGAGAATASTPPPRP